MTREILTITPRITVTEAAEIMAKARVSCLLVMEDEQPLGIVTERDLVRAWSRSTPPEQAVTHIMTAPVLCASGAMDWREAYHLLAQKGIRHLLVSDAQGKVAGIVTESDFRRHLSTRFLAKFKNLTQVMSAEPLMFPPEANLLEAAHLMERLRASCAVVVVDDKPLGILTERDVTRLFAQHVDCEHTTIASAMTAPAWTVTYDISLLEAFQMMQDRNIRHLVIVHDDGRLAGVLSEHDIVALLENQYLGDLRQHNQVMVEAYQVSETRYRQLFENMTSGFALYEVIFSTQGQPVDCRILEVNPAYEALFQLRAHELIGKTLLDVMPSLAERWIGVLSDTALTGKAASFEDFCNRQSRWLSAKVFCPQKGMVAVLVNDITDTREADATLQAQQAQLRAILDNFPFLIWLKDQDSRFLAVNDAFARACGESNPDMLVGKTDFDVWPADLATRYRMDDKTVLGSLNRHVVEERINGPQGERWFETYKTPVIDKQGQLLGSAGFARDITERKQLDQRLQLAASVFAHTHEGILITDIHGKILEVNDAFVRLSGYSRDEAIGQYPSMLKSGRQDPDFYNRMWQSLRQTGYWHGEIWNKRKDGALYAETLTISATRDKHGETVGYVALFSDITSLKETQQQLELLAYHDALTNLPNRTLLSDRLSQALAHARRRGTLLAVCYLDLDGFKGVNDQYGHEAGDTLLMEVARRLVDSVRADDTVSRLGGDEFALLLCDLANEGEAHVILSRVLQVVSTPYVINQVPISTISASIGVTIFPTDDVDPDTLLRHSDQAMYTAKQTGRNRVHVFDAEQDRRTQAHREIRSQVHHALENNEFRLFYQPKVNLRQGQVIGAEALIRWQLADGTLRPPASFLPAIEGTDMIIDVGDWVLKTAMEQMRSWQAQGLEMSVSVNIAARQLQHPDFVRKLRSLLAEFPDVPPSRLELEILETAALEDMSRVSQIIDTCHSMGVGFALDDFGTGYSSLTYFKRLPAKTLKIDQSFIRDMLEDQEDMAIVEGILGLTTAFSRRAVAEGVETIEHGLLLLHIGCDLAQGYGIARPMPADRLPDWVKNFKPHPAWADSLQVPWRRQDFPLIAAGLEHQHTLDTLNDYLNGRLNQLPTDLLRNTSHCRLSGWLSRVPEAMREIEAFVELHNIHQQLHQRTQQALDLIEAGDRHGAAQILPTLYQLLAELDGAIPVLQMEVVMFNPSNFRSMG